MSQHHATILAHQFDDLAQQKEACTLGMWAFLATEVMFFGGAFLAYAVYRANYPEAFIAASQLENWRIGFLNTGVLLCSSLTVVLAVHAAQAGDNRAVIKWLLLTTLCALIFLGVKAYEYNHIISHHHAPWQRDFMVHVPGENPVPGYQSATKIFFSLYFCMTGIHAAHMVIGLGLFGWLVALARRNRFAPNYYTPVEMVGLYWHFVDIVWIFLYPLFYLIEPRW